MVNQGDSEETRHKETPTTRAPDLYYTQHLLLSHFSLCILLQIHFKLLHRHLTICYSKSIKKSLNMSSVPHSIQKDRIIRGRDGDWVTLTLKTTGELRLQWFGLHPVLNRCWRHFNLEKIKLHTI